MRAISWNSVRIKSHHPFRIQSSYDRLRSDRQALSIIKARLPLGARPVFSHGSLRSIFTVAIIGSGPAGFYTALRVMQKIPNSKIDMFEERPVPYGLVRFGVAPDHPEVKVICQQRFHQVAQSDRFRFIGNVSVGKDVELDAIWPNYHAIVFAYGASRDKTLGIPGEDSGNVFSARAFVGWYNGDPEFANLDPQLDSGEQAVIIGNGNVSLDVARILLSPIDRLKGTDISSHALQSLSKSTIKSVRVVGRRGPLQAAFSTKETRELLDLPGVSTTPISPDLLPETLSGLPRKSRRLAELLKRGSVANHSPGPKQLTLDFLLSPISINSRNKEDNTIQSITFLHNEFLDSSDRFSTSARVGSLDPESTPPSTIEASLSVRCIGSSPVPLNGFDQLGIPFRPGKGVIPSDECGRVRLSCPSPAQPRKFPLIYCVGWVKNGANGVIAQTMEDAFSVSEAIGVDYSQTRPEQVENAAREGWPKVLEAIRGTPIKKPLVDWQAWLRVEDAESKLGLSRGKPREKFTHINDLLKVALNSQ